MKIFKSKSWQFEVHGQDGYVILFGKNIFDYKWESTGKSVTVKDPLYHQDHRFILLPRENSVTAYGVSTHINIRLNIKANREIKSGAVFKKNCSTLCFKVFYYQSVFLFYLLRT